MATTAPYRLKSEGTILVPFGGYPMSRSSFDRLSALVAPGSVSYSTVHVGDAGEPNDVAVARVIVDDHGTPRRVEASPVDEVMEILFSPAMKTWLEGVTETAALRVRRCQVHILSAGNFVGRHRDLDSNPDYVCPVVLQFSDDYAGGDYVVHDVVRGPMSFATRRGDLLITDPNIEHEVRPVTAGERQSLVYFLSR